MRRGGAPPVPAARRIRPRPPRAVRHRRSGSFGSCSSPRGSCASPERDRAGAYGLECGLGRDGDRDLAADVTVLLRSEGLADLDERERALHPDPEIAALDVLAEPIEILGPDPGELVERLDAVLG